MRKAVFFCILIIATCFFGLSACEKDKNNDISNIEESLTIKKPMNLPSKLKDDEVIIPIDKLDITIYKNVSLALVLVYKCGHEKFNKVKYFYERCVLNVVQKRCKIFPRIQTSDY